MMANYDPNIGHCLMASCVAHDKSMFFHLKSARSAAGFFLIARASNLNLQIIFAKPFGIDALSPT